jgi:hypothetical protein
METKTTCGKFVLKNPIKPNHLLDSTVQGMQDLMQQIQDTKPSDDMYATRASDFVAWWLWTKNGERNSLMFVICNRQIKPRQDLR